jgi:MYXO-CTERM domain-containing protein
MTASTCIAGTASVVGDEVVWIAPPRGGSDALVPFTTYVVSFADASGGSNRITFTTGRGPSAGPPVFGGVSGVSAAPAAGDPCDSQAVDITVRFPRATSPVGTSALNNSTWPESDIEYVIFETRGPGLTGARERDRVRLQRSGSSDVNAQRTFRLSGRDSTGPVCFSIQAFDPWGRRDDNTQEKCVNPAQGNFFAGCGVHPAGPWRARGSLGLLALSVATARRRRRRGADGAGGG